MRPRTLQTTLLFLLIVAPAGAQYNPPGSTVAGSGLPDEEDLRTDMDEASWHVGVLRLQPWIGIRDASLVTSSRDDETDFTVSAGAGLRAYAKTGPKVVWAAHFLPEYTWWQDDEDKRRLNGRYGLGAFAYFNRLNLEVSARRNEAQAFFSSELQELTSTRNDVGRFAFELELRERLAVVGTYQVRKSENREDDSSVFGLLDQETATAGLSLRYRTPQGFSVEGGVEDTENDFASQARNLSNTGEAARVAVGYEGRRFNALLRLERRSLEATEGSDFVDLDTTTGLFETTWSLHRSVDLLFYGRREIGYSIRNEFSNLLIERFGARSDLSLGDWSLFLAAEIGSDEFRSTGMGTGERSDDVLAFGMGLAFDLANVLRLNVALTHNDYDSDTAGFDRDVTAWTASLQLLSLAEKLGFGEAERIW